MESEGLRFDSSCGLRIFFFVPCLWQRWKKHPSLFLYQAQSLPSLNSIYKHYTIDIADPSSMQEAVIWRIRARNLKVWGLIPHGDSFFLCPTLMTRWKKTYFSNFKNVITYELKVFKWEKTRSIPYTYNGWFDFFLS